MAVLQPPSLLKSLSKACCSGSNGLGAGGIDSSIQDDEDNFQLTRFFANKLEESVEI